MVHLPLGGRSSEVTNPLLKESVPEAPEAQQLSEDGLPPPETLHKQNAERNITISTQLPS